MHFIKAEIMAFPILYIKKTFGSFKALLCVSLFNGGALHFFLPLLTKSSLQGAGLRFELSTYLAAGR
jgi:hypothetical protein